jgi:hypothetical protein
VPPRKRVRVVASIARVAAVATISATKSRWEINQS